MKTTEHHTLTLEHACYPSGPPEVTAAFCSCGETFEPEGKSAGDEIGYVALLFAVHVSQEPQEGA